MPGIVYKFQNQSIQTFFENVKFMDDLSFAIYFDFETTCGKKAYNFDDDISMYPVSYAFAVAFHPSLNLDRVSVVKSFNHAFDQLNSMGYLLDEMLSCFDPITVHQLLYCAQEVYEKKFVIDLLKAGSVRNILDVIKNLIFSQSKSLRRKILLTGKKQIV